MSIGSRDGVRVGDAGTPGTGPRPAARPARAGRRSPRWLALLVVGVVILAGACSDDDSGVSSGNGSNTTSSSGSGSGGTTAGLQVQDFTAVVVAGSMNVKVTVGPATSAEVRGPADETSKVTAQVDGGSLFLRTPQGFSQDGNLLVVLSTPSLAQASISGQANLDVTGVSADRFVAEIAGAGNLNAAGTAKDVTAVLGGSGNLGLDQLVADTVDVQLIGQGNVGVNATQKLKVNIIGNGNVVYRGDPTVEKVITGNGTVQKAG